MAFEALLYDVADGVATITINRPDRHNALSWAAITELRQAVADAREDNDVRVVVLTGAGERAFCSGADLSGMASDTAFAQVHDARFGVPEIDRGLWPYMITVPMVRSMAPKQALELMMTGRRVDAAEAARIGFVTRVVPVEELDTAVADLAATLAGKSPVAMKLGRDSFYAVWDQAAADALPLLQSLLTITTMTEDAREGIAAFAEKRPPVWKGR